MRTQHRRTHMAGRQQLQFLNVNARMTRAEPIADFREAFPSMFASETVHFPGTSGAGSNLHRDKDKDKEKGGGKGKRNRLFDADASGPGSKSKLAMPISSDELWLLWWCDL